MPSTRIDRTELRVIALYYQQRLLLRRKRTLVRKDAIRGNIKDHKLFKQIEFKHQDIIINTNDEERNTKIPNGEGSLKPAGPLSFFFFLNLFFTFIEVRDSRRHFHS